MENTRGSNGGSHAGTRAACLRLLICLSALICCSGKAVTVGDFNHPRHSRRSFRHDMPASVRPDHPAIQPLVAAIRKVSLNPMEQLVIVNDVTHLLVDYDEDERVYGSEEFHATFDEMLERRRAGGWLYLRDDCDGRAVFAAHVLAALGIEWRLQASFWKEHAWIVARVNGVDYDLLDLRKNAPETARLSYKLLGRHFVRPTNKPTLFHWRRAWVERTGQDLNVGLQLGLLAMDSKPGDLRQRNSTDWTAKAPGKLLPLDDRARGVAIAGFPYGEPLHVGAIASTAALKPVGAAPALGAMASAGEDAAGTKSGSQ